MTSVDGLEIGSFGELECRGEIVLEELLELFGAHKSWLNADWACFVS